MLPKFTDPVALDGETSEMSFFEMRFGKYAFINVAPLDLPRFALDFLTMNYF